jgi:GH35 family endo-1,4-beta-xylanase
MIHSLEEESMMKVHLGSMKRARERSVLRTALALCIALASIQVIAAQGAWDLSLPSLAEKYKGRFLVGNVMSAGQADDPDITAMFKRQYNAVTAENDMKPQYLAPWKDGYNFINSDLLVAWAEKNGMKIHGHTLIWHSQSAAWLNKDDTGGPLTRAEAKANLEEYINAVAGHFQGKFLSWDVVNEALDGGMDDPADWRTALRENSPWFRAYDNGADAAMGESGGDYIYDAFVTARLADPKAVLYYNDYNETSEWKREAMALMAEDLNKKWKKDSRNKQRSRKLVEGLGMQAHYWVEDLKVADVDATIARFVKAGVKVSITELDIPAGTYSNQRTPPLAEEDANKQALLYAQLFEIFMKYKGKIERVTFWGKADSQSWRSNGSPTLFDRDFAAKPSFHAVLDYKEYLKKQ